MQLIPIGDSILYVRPIYVATTEGATFPRFKYVAVTYGEQLGALALDPRRDQLAVRSRQPSAPTTRTGSRGPPPATGTVASLLARAQNEFDAADAALKKGDLATYAQGHQAAQADVAAAIKVARRERLVTGAKHHHATTTTSAAPTTSATSATSTTTTTTVPRPEPSRPPERPATASGRQLVGREGLLLSA